MSLRKAINHHPLISKYFHVLRVADMIPAEYRKSGIKSYWDPEHGWSDIMEAWTEDEFVLDATRITLSVSASGWDGDTFKNQILMDRHGIQINKTSRNTVLFMTNIGTTRSSIAYLIEVLVDRRRARRSPRRRQQRREKDLRTQRSRRCARTSRPCRTSVVSTTRSASATARARRKGDIRSRFFAPMTEQVRIPADRR